MLVIGSYNGGLGSHAKIDLDIFLSFSAYPRHSNDNYPSNVGKQEKIVPASFRYSAIQITY